MIWSTSRLILMVGACDSGFLPLRILTFRSQWPNGRCCVADTSSSYVFDMENHRIWIANLWSLWMTTMCPELSKLHSCFFVCNMVKCFCCYTGLCEFQDWSSRDWCFRRLHSQRVLIFFFGNYDYQNSKPLHKKFWYTFLGEMPSL